MIFIRSFFSSSSLYTFGGPNEQTEIFFFIYLFFEALTFIRPAPVTEIYVLFGLSNRVALISFFYMQKLALISCER